MIRYSAFFILLLFGLTTCEKKSYPPILSSVDPVRAAIYDDIVLTGSQFGDNPTVLFGNEQADIISKSGSRLTVTVPNMQLGSTTIRVRNGDGESAPLPFTVLQPLSFVTSFSPSSGKVGSEVLINGVFLSDVIEVRFGNGASSAASFQRSGTSLRAVVPANATTGPICVRSAGGWECSLQTFTIDIPQAVPIISSVSPDKGVAGTEITINGQNLQNAQEVKIGEQTVTVKSNSNTSTSLKVDAPAFSSEQSVAITVRTSAGTATGGSFRGLPVPAIDKSRCAPTGLVPGSHIILRGSNFNAVSQVQFANTSVNSSDFIRFGGDEIMLKVPAGTTAGDVRIVNQYATSGSVRFDLVTGGSELTTGNISTNINTLTAGSLSDNCIPELFGYCLNGTCMIYSTISRYAESATCRDCKDATCVNSCKDCNDRYRYKEETFYGAKYHAFRQMQYQSPQYSVLKFERTPDDKGYSGFVVFEKDGITYVGNVLTGNGSIVLKSITNGTALKLCKVLPLQGQLTIGIFSNYSAMCNSVRCDVCN